MLTYRFRVKGAHGARVLNSLAPIVNQVWNYCNATSYHAIRNHGKFLSWVDLNKLTTGSSKLLGLASETINAVGEEYAKSRNQFKKRKLKWRASKGTKKALGWVPFKARSIRLKGNKAIYLGHEIKFWNSWDGSNPRQRVMEGAIKTGSFSQDSKGDWYLNVTCEDKQGVKVSEADVGIDLGLKSLAALSNGEEIENPRHFRKTEAKLGMAQRANKPRLAKNLHKKVRNQRKDFLHKITTNLASRFSTIFVGNVSAKALQKMFGKSETDAAWGIFRELLKYKAIRRSGVFKVVSEASTTVTCSTCLNKTGPSGLSGLVIREWVCSSCDSRHLRDINSAINILRLGYQTP
jgi:putative transposase